MIDMYSKYDNMDKNGIFYALIFINNHIFACLDCMLSMVLSFTFKVFLMSFLRSFRCLTSSSLHMISIFFSLLLIQLLNTP